jgi:uncharacterized protein
MIRKFTAIAFVTACYYLIVWLNKYMSVLSDMELPGTLSERASWVFAVEHHAIQLILALVLIGVTGLGKFTAWGLNLGNYNESIKIFKSFCYYYIVWFLGVSFIIQLLSYPGPPFHHSFNTIQILGYLGFGFILTGLSEEILFRGFIHTFLAKYFTKIRTRGKIEMPDAGILTAVLFTIAHIGFTIYPFEIWYIEPLQLVQAFVLGLFYSWAYHRTGSLLAPILAHNVSNGAMWSMDYILYWLKGL